MRMWEIREGYSPREFGQRDDEGRKAYEMGYEHGYEDAMEKSGMMGERRYYGHRYPEMGMREDYGQHDYGERGYRRDSMGRFM